MDGRGGVSVCVGGRGWGGGMRTDRARHILRCTDREIDQTTCKQIGRQTNSQTVTEF